MHGGQTRREWVIGSAAAAAAAYLGLPALARAAAPAAPVAVVRCRTYDPAEVQASLHKMFDQLGGLRRLVNNKTVSVKINLTGSPTVRLGGNLIGETTYTNPFVIGATVHLLGRAGAKRIRLLESPTGSGEPIPEFISRANWDLNAILNAAKNVEFVNTNFAGANNKFARFNISTGGYIFPGFDLNPAYADCDVFMSLAKMKEHLTAGITLSMKNCFGITPCTIYGNGAGLDEPSLTVSGGRQNVCHTGSRAPSKSAPQENDSTTPRDGGYRMPRIVTDICSARPIDIAIVEAVKTMAGSELARPINQFISPGLIVAGTNAVNTDAVCVSLMGYDPMSERGRAPFESCDNTLALAEAIGLGSRDVKRIDVRGVQIADARLNFPDLRKARASAPTGRSQWDAVSGATRPTPPAAPTKP